MLISPEENLPFTSAEALKWKLLDLQASRGSSKLRLVVKNVTDEELGAATAELSFKKKMMRIWRELEGVIIRVMPSVKHEVTQRDNFRRNSISHRKNPGS